MLKWINFFKFVNSNTKHYFSDAVRQSSNLDESVFQVLDKMEALQNEVLFLLLLIFSLFVLDGDGRDISAFILSWPEF